ncbi:MAG: tRNA (adenosine(37)-N6)-dimethylallyltransferase MiaA [Hyphomicrobiaceae bacterium]
MDAQRPILIAGPTASGKSALAMTLAGRHGGVIVNADSMQVYRELRILTARPSPEDEARVPHRLFGFVPAAEAYSVGRYVADVARVLGELRETEQRPVIVGGTGLYFKALLEGLAPIPDIPPDIRARWRAAAETEPAQELHAVLADKDPASAARLASSDTQRIVRALEVIEATGRSLAAWQAIRGTPLLDEAACERIVVAPPRPDIHRRLEARFDAMLAGGALDEVRGLGALDLAPDLPAMRALGVAPLLAHLRGESDLAVAAERAKAETRQYVKRQLVWLRRNMSSWNWIETT